MSAPHTTSGSTRKDAVLRAVAHAAERLLAADRWQDRVDDALAELGRATRADRVYVFRMDDPDGDLLASQLHEWVGGGVTPQIDNPDLQGIPLLEAGYGRWMEVLRAGGTIHGSVADFPPSEQPLLESQDILSLVVVPVLVDGAWWGFVGFDATHQEVVWDEAEVDALRAAAGVLGAAIGKEAVVAELTESRASLRRAFEREQEVVTRLRELDEMKSMFLDAVSHELRTPLTTVSGYAATLQRLSDDLDPSIRARVVAGLSENVARLERLLGDLLDLGRLRRDRAELRTEPLQLLPLVRDTARECARQHGRDVTIHAPDDVEVHLDRTVVERILTNLVGNAAVHTPVAARIWVHADVGDGDTVELRVEDDGPGVPEELREVVFQPFQHGVVSRPHAPGTGIGLDLVARFAALHGGRAWCAERPGGGAAFHVVLATRAAAPVGQGA